MPTRIIDQNRGFRVWGLPQIYVGPAGTEEQAYVPNVNDAVWDWQQGTFRVTDVDYTTGISTLIPQDINNQTGGLLQEDELLGTGPGPVSQSYRVYLNSETVPFNASFDARLKIYAVNADHIKLFKGTDTGNTGTVVSAILNPGGVMVSENIPLNLVQTVNGANYAVRTPAQFVMTEQLSDGEIVTAVVYSSAGAPISASKLITVNTDFIRTTDASKKYVVSIEIITPFMSPTDNHLLEYPLNMVVQSGQLMGKVRYSDGTNVVLPIDGTRFELQGMESYIATTVGQRKPLVLVYHMTSNEYSFANQSVGADRFMVEPYTITTVEAQGVYSVKLFAVPEWRGAPSVKWELDWYLYNLERDVIYNVTPYTEYATGSTPFNGLSLNARQPLTVAVNLHEIGASFNFYRYVETLAITLLAQGTSVGVSGYYKIEYTDGVNYGTTLKAAAGPSATPGMYMVNVGNGIATFSDFITEVFRKIEPLFAPGIEGLAPDPTHFRLRVGSSWVREIPIGNYNLLQDLITAQPIQGRSVRLEFFRRAGGSDLELGVAPMPIEYVL